MRAEADSNRGPSAYQPNAGRDLSVKGVKAVDVSFKKKKKKNERRMTAFVLKYESYVSINKRNKILCVWIHVGLNLITRVVGAWRG